MNTLKLTGLALVGIATIAIAQTPPLAATHGRGIAANGDRRAEFNFEVVKRNNDAGVAVVRGAINVSTGSQNPPVRIELGSRSIRVLEVNGTNANFSGPGRLVRRTADGVQSIEGFVRCHVEDLASPTGGRTQDRFVVTFVRPNAAATDPPAFAFEGNVVRGDLVVRSAN